MKKVILLFVALPLLLVSTIGMAAPVVPDSGIKAEMEERWQDAISIYQKSLKAVPDQPHLWKRISDIEARLGHKESAADALEKATKVAPKDANLFYLLSQARANADQPQKALLASKRAVELLPDNIDYLRARAVHANWVGEHGTAVDSYKRILSIQPDDADAQLGLAHTYDWQKDYKNAAKAYRAYVDQHQQDKKALMEYMEVEAELGNYDSAVGLAEVYRKHFGEGLKYWLFVSDMYALSGNDVAAAEALEKATKFASDDPKLFFRVAQSFTSVERADRALKAIQHALMLDPNNIEYYRTQAELAAWRANYPLALESYQQILTRQPDDPGALLGKARVHYWMGDADAAIKGYQYYLQKHSRIQVVWAEYIQVLTEVGSYDKAFTVLEEYRAQFGDTNDYKKQKAYILTWAGHPREALAITTPLLKELPQDPMLKMTHTIALYHNHQPAEAVASLAELYRTNKDYQENESTRLYIQTPLRSSIRLYGGYQTDTDDITIRHVGVKGTYVKEPNLRFWLAGEKQNIEAPIDSGFQTAAGDKTISYTTGVLGMRYNHSASLALDVEAGRGDIEDGDGQTIYNIAADIWPRDGLSLRLSRQQGLYAVSPLATSNEILRRNNQLDLSWQPNFRYTVDAMASGSSYSDNNTRADFAIAPRRSVIRNQHFSLDLGIGAHWFAYDKELNDGYYSPTDYKRYSLNAFGSWLFNENNGIRTSISVGHYKDNTMDNYHSAGDITLEGYMGTYKDWMLDARAAFSQNTGIETGAYRSRLFEIGVTKRF